jgi:hypothetical protein
MPTKVTWYTTDRHTLVPDLLLTQVHLILEDNLTTDDLRHAHHATLCKREIGLWSSPRVVKTWNDRPCLLCVKQAHKQNLDVDYPTIKKRKKDAMAATDTTPTVRKVNFQGLNKPLPAQVWETTLDGYKFGMSKPSNANPNGAEMCTLIFLIVDEGDYKGRKLYRNFMTDGNALFYFFDCLVKLGADPEELAPEDGSDIDIEPIIKGLMQAHCYVRTSVGNYNGKETTNVDEVLPFAS